MFKLLLRTAVEELRPVAFKVYTDAGEFLPFNSHMAHFAGPDEVLRDIALIRRLYAVGHRGLQLPPLGQVGGILGDFIFHLWRTSDQRRRLRCELDQAVALERHADRETVLNAATSGQYILDAEASGFTVSAGPHPLNSFMEQFYLDILRGE
ncbi:hypothetical protein [Embleya hyalina]|uniref:hypothetical protein n=1 Tax=Embleya hyalina TaxID=516124 RepID=UPI000F81C3F9|nr:hypothetical protein [Embleya hyalina]